MNEFPFRIGQGFDVHPWSDDPERELVLGGVHFSDHPGLAGHSDADAVAHACTDAILGAAGLGDIGQQFPDTDPTHTGANSLQLLAVAVELLEDAGWRVGNIDCTVILDAPKIAPHRDEMERRLSETVRARVTVKGKRTEGVPGLQGGVQCHAVALVVEL